MTVLIAWAGVDQRGPASLYFASDSRISWSNGASFDGGQKLFSARTKAHILGFYGDVTFPSQVLTQVVHQIDSDLLFAPGTSPTACLRRIVDTVGESVSQYPETISCDFGILHGMRHGELMDSEFHLSHVSFKNRGASVQVVDIGAAVVDHKGRRRSPLLADLGSGAVAFKESFDRWNDSDVGGTSRAVFSALADAIRGGKDPRTGGHPQLVGLYRKGPAQVFGVVWEQQRWALGKKVDTQGNVRATKWHNDLFEITDPVELLREKGSQPQPRPRSLEKK